MVIFFNMIVKKSLPVTIALFLTLFLLTLFSSKIYAAIPSFSFYPESGVISAPENGFTVDILIDSGGEQLTSARMVFTFDPRLVQMTKASRNNTLFDQWPEDESTLDNENGVVMLTGFTQSGADELYQTTGEPDLFARIEFEIVPDDARTNVRLEWEFDGTDDLFKTTMLKEGSPPQIIFNNRPDEAISVLRVKDGKYDDGSGDDGDGDDGDGNLDNQDADGTPQTAISMSSIPFIVGGFLIFTAGVVITAKPSTMRKKFCTVVVSDD
jgi:hypothetical protein